MAFFNISDVSTFGYKFTAETLNDTEMLTAVSTQVNATIFNITGLEPPPDEEDNPNWSPRIGVWLAQYYCASESANQSDNVVKDIASKYNDALSELKQIAARTDNQDTGDTIELLTVDKMEIYEK